MRHSWTVISHTNPSKVGVLFHAIFFQKNYSQDLFCRNRVRKANLTNRPSDQPTYHPTSQPTNRPTNQLINRLTYKNRKTSYLQLHFDLHLLLCSHLQTWIDISLKQPYTNVTIVLHRNTALCGSYSENLCHLQRHNLVQAYLETGLNLKYAHLVLFA